MPETDDTPTVGGFEAYIAAAAEFLAIPVDPSWLGAIGGNLAVLHAAASFVGAFPLPDEAEVAPVYVA